MIEGYAVDDKDDERGVLYVVKVCYGCRYGRRFPFVVGTNGELKRSAIVGMGLTNSRSAHRLCFGTTCSLYSHNSITAVNLTRPTDNHHLNRTCLTTKNR